MASTADCKKLIDEHASEFGYSSTSKWKRTRKYKEDGFILRTFDSDNGDTVTISEDNAGKLQIKFAFVNTPFDPKLKATLTKENLIYGLVKAFLDNAQSRLINIEEWNYGEITEVGFERMKEYIETQDASRIFDVHKYLRLDEDSGFILNIIRELDELPTTNFVNDLSKDVVGVNYDKENIDTEFHEYDGMHFLKVTMGGDWEWPVYGYVYWSEVEQRVKGFFPTGDGNVYNTDLNCAWGSEFDYKSDLAEAQLEKYEEQADEIMSETGLELVDKAMKAGQLQLKAKILQESIDLLNK